MNISTNVTKLELLTREVARILDVDKVEADVGMGELGIDSLNVVELLLVCEQLYGEVNPEQIEIDQFTTLRAMDSQLRISVLRSP